MKFSSFTPFLCICLICFFSCGSNNSGTSADNKSDTAPEVKSIFIEGDSIHYIEMGQGEPVVFVHGTLGDYRTWGAQMDTFARNYSVITYSRRFAYPNNAAVDDSADYTIARHAKDLTAFLKALNRGPVHLIGHSYGAATALSTAIEHPDLVKSLTLGEPPVMSLLTDVPGGDTILNNFVTHVIFPASEAFKVNDSVKAIGIFVGGVMGDSAYFSRLSERDHELIMANVPELRGTAFTKNPFSPVNCNDLKKIKVPVLLVKGETSPLLFQAITGELERCLPNRETATLENTSHGLQYENPTAFNQSVLRFLDKN